jgi:phospholipid/cholesterol/gamma-HCH transport system permease protein
VKQSSEWLRIEQAGDEIRVRPLGNWRIGVLERLQQALQGAIPAGNSRIIIDGSELGRLDTAGSMLLLRAVSPSLENLGDVRFENLEDRHLTILDLVRTRLADRKKLQRPETLGFFARVGRMTRFAGDEFLDMVNFIGQLSLSVLECLAKPKLLRMKEFIVQLRLVLVDAIPVTALVTFLIGVVVAYLYSMQAEKYGANIFIVDGIGFAMCRELSPIIAAIIAAGRSGSAFTAQIGTMKINEEVDALVTLGLSPIHVLVLPRIAALMIAMPLLVFIGDLMGILGGMLIADQFLSITPRTFLDRMQVVLYLRHVFVGWIKAPAFALFIAMIGCRHGLTVEDNARSVGLKTTSTVVRAIVSVIILNAIFAITFARLGI